MLTHMSHDKLFKYMMRFPSFQQAFARRHVPKHIQKIVNLDALRQVSEQLAQAHKLVVPDCILSAPFYKGPGRFYLLVEQETSPRKEVLVRLMQANLRIVEFDLCSIQGEPVPPLVWCLLFCTGPDRYKANVDLFAGLHPEVRPIVKEAFVEAPQVFHVQDAQEVTHSEAPELDAVELLMKHIRKPDLEQVLGQLEPLLQEVLHRHNGAVMLNALLNYALAHGSTNEKYDTIGLEGRLHGQVEEVYMKMAEALRQQGRQEAKLTYMKMAEASRQEGRQEGKVLGLEEGRLQIAQNLLKAGVDHKIIAQTTGLSVKRIAAMAK
ncbi:MAG: Rpn family recombination-promoting nuclease/putative transposase [Myxococcota bacterium]